MRKIKGENIKVIQKNSAYKCLNSYGYSHIIIKSDILEAVQNNEKIIDYLLNNKLNFKFIQIQKRAFKTNNYKKFHVTGSFHIISHLFHKHFM